MLDYFTGGRLSVQS